jgi:hypothetical protein
MILLFAQITGPGAGAEWPVASEVYHYLYKVGFTPTDRTGTACAVLKFLNKNNLL